MPEWLIERGIGETRAALIADGEIVETRIELDRVTRAGGVTAARLITAASRNAVARDEAGNEYLLPRGATGVTEGALLNIEIARERIPGAEAWKRPLARPTEGQVRRPPSRAGRELSLPAARAELAAAEDEERHALVDALQVERDEEAEDRAYGDRSEDVDGELRRPSARCAGRRAEGGVGERVHGGEAEDDHEVGEDYDAEDRFADGAFAAGLGDEREGDGR